MATAPTYPGVYIEEVPSGVRTITGVATSIAAFIDVFKRGPVDEAVRVLSFADFERDFGGLDSASSASYGIRQFFLNGGSEAWIVRVGSGADAAHLTLNTTPTGTTAAVNVRAGRRIRGAAVDDPGTWGDSVRLEVDYDTPQGVELFNLIVSEVAPGGASPTPMRSEVFRNLTMRPGVPNNALEVVNESSKLVQLDRDGLASLPSTFDTFRPAATGTLGDALPASPSIPASGDELNVNAGAGDRLVTITYTGAITTYEELRPILEAAIRAADPDDPLIAGASVRLVPSGDAGNPSRFHVTAGRGGPTFDPSVKLTFTEAGGSTADELKLKGAAKANDAQYGLEDGDDGTAPTATALRGSDLADTGLYALDDVDLFNILCVPAAAELSPSDMRSVYSECESYCELRRAFVIVDVPEAVDELSDMELWISQNAGLRHTNAAVYFPRPRIADPLNDNRLRSVGASGTVAGSVRAHRRDARRLEGARRARRHASQRPGRSHPAHRPRERAAQSARRQLPAQLPDAGNVVWGARTLAGADALASEWKYVPVRRTALFLEESALPRHAVGRLRAERRAAVGADPAQRRRVHEQPLPPGRLRRERRRARRTSSSATRETTTQDDINLGIVNIVVGFAPLKPAEFVVIKIQQMAGQIAA